MPAGLRDLVGDGAGLVRGSRQTTCVFAAESFAAVSLVAGLLGSACAGPGPVDTGEEGWRPPIWLPPPPEVTGQVDGLEGGDFVVGAVFDEPSFAFAVDRSGEWVWAEAIPSGRLAVQALLDVSRRGIRTTSFDAGMSDPAARCRLVDGTGQTLETLELPWAHHVMTQHADGTLAWLALDIREWTDPETGEVDTVVGDALWETAPDGSSREVSNTWDWLEVEPNDGWIFSLYPQGVDWTHANSVQHLPERGTYLVGFYQLDSVVELDAKTGLPLRWFTARPDLPVPEGAELFVLEDGFHHPHDANLTEAGTLMMVSSQPYLRALELSVGEGVLEETWTWGEELEEVAPVLGQARRLPGGDTLYLNSPDGMLRQIDADGEVRWSMRFGGLGVGQVQLVSADPAGGLFASD